MFTRLSWIYPFKIDKGLAIKSGETPVLNTKVSPCYVFFSIKCSNFVLDVFVKCLLHVT